MTPPAIRVIHDPPLDGPTNMARDEALLERVGRGASPPTLRLYQWHPPTISLGYFQPYADYESLPAPAGELPVVRRLTGGGAILHDLELTYSLALPTAHRLVADGPNTLYELVHDAVIESLGAMQIEANPCGTTDDSTPRHGPFFCFARRHCFDVVVGDDKLAGSAQRRTRQALLQHGSIVLANRYAQQPTATVPLPIEQAIEQVRADLVRNLENLSGESLVEDSWTDAELTEAQGLVEKYATAPWTRRS